MEKEKVLNSYKKYFSPAALELKKQSGMDIIEHHGEGSYITDIEGKKYIDAVSSDGIFNLGRRNPELISELRKAVESTDQGNFPMISIEKGLLAEKIAAFTPGNFECSVFSVIRGESTDFACKLARGYTGRKEFISFKGAFHGQTGFAFSLSDRKDRGDFGSLIPEIRTIEYNDINAAGKAISKKTAAVFIELIQAENACRTAGYSYLKQLEKLCRKNGALLVVDETQSGLGRAGAKFIFEEAGILPDVLIIGESLGGGIFPIAATVFPQKLNAFMNKHPMIHLSTFGGSDIGCKVALRALEIYEKTRPWENATAMGLILKSSLEAFMSSHSGTVRAVNGRGLLLGMELKNEESAKTLCRNSAREGLLIKQGETAKNSVIFRPSLLINEKECGEIVKALKSAASGM